AYGRTATVTHSPPTPRHLRANYLWLCFLIGITDRTDGHVQSSSDYSAELHRGFVERRRSPGRQSGSGSVRAGVQGTAQPASSNSVSMMPAVKPQITMSRTANAGPT